VLWILAGVALALLIYEAATLVTAVLLPLWHNPQVLQTDFHYYYDAAVRFRGDPSRLYLPTDDVIAGFAYPPPAIVPFAWLSHLPLGQALVVFTIVSYAIVLAAIGLWIRYLKAQGRAIDGRTLAAVIVIALASGPTYMNAIFGQVNGFVLFCSVAFIALTGSHLLIAGALLATGAWLKIYPALIVMAGLWNRRAWRPIGYAAITATIIVVVLLPMVPWHAYEQFALEVLPTRFDKTALHISNQSLVAFLERFFVPPERFLNWTGEQAITSGAVVRAANWLTGIVIIVFLWRRAVLGPRLESVDSAAGLIALAAVIAPLGWGHTFVLVLPLVILHLASTRDATTPQAVTIALCVLALMIPAGRRFGFIEQLPAWMQNLAYSRYLLATLILIALPQAAAPYTESRRPS
jgi:alpha-1,2-mannosyltransferase